MTSAQQVQIAFAAIGVLALLLVFVCKGVSSFHLNNEMIRQARGPERPSRPETALEAKQALAMYMKEQPAGNLRKAKRVLVYSDVFLWITMIALLLIIWNISADR